MDTQEWLLKKNCSLSPRQFMLSYASLCMFSLLVAAMSAWHGAWFVLFFAVGEMLAVALAFLHHARHATDHEHIALAEDCLLIEQVEAGQTRQIRLDPCWTQISTPRRPQDLIRLQGRGIQVEVGRYVTAPKRSQLARELHQSLRMRSSIS